jgi:hypothetical protein
MTPDRDELRWFAREVAEQACMPALYQLAARIDPFPLGLLGGALGAFLVSRWDLIEEDPDPRHWAEEFVRAGGPKVMAAGFCLIIWGEMLILAALPVVVQLVGRHAGDDGAAAGTEALGWFCLAIGPVVALLGVIACTAYLRLHKDWLRRQTGPPGSGSA